MRPSYGIKGEEEDIRIFQNSSILHKRPVRIYDQPIININVNVQPVIIIIKTINKSETFIILVYDIWLPLYLEGASLYMYQSNLYNLVI